jgi:hypothetical protein
MRSAGGLKIQVPRLTASRAERPEDRRRGAEDASPRELIASAHTDGARRVWRDVLADCASGGLHKIELRRDSSQIGERPNTPWSSECRPSSLAIKGDPVRDMLYPVVQRRVTIH